jgi:hypothetical protein
MPRGCLWRPVITMSSDGERGPSHQFTMPFALLCVSQTQGTGTIALRRKEACTRTETHRRPTLCPPRQPLRAQRRTVHGARLPARFRAGGLVGTRLTALVAWLRGSAHPSHAAIQVLLGKRPPRLSQTRTERPSTEQPTLQGCTGGVPRRARGIVRGNPQLLLRVTVAPSDRHRASARTRARPHGAKHGVGRRQPVLGQPVNLQKARQRCSPDSPG